MMIGKKKTKSPRKRVKFNGLAALIVEVDDQPQRAC